MPKNKSLFDSEKEKNQAFDKKMAEYDKKIEELKKKLIKRPDRSE
ncbi:hypothetical protein [Bacillus salacetis]|nr:hypothetical protein [Bacillus salacetis]